MAAEDCEKSLQYIDRVSVRRVVYTAVLWSGRLHVWSGNVSRHSPNITAWRTSVYDSVHAHTMNAAGATGVVLVLMLTSISTGTEQHCDATGYCEQADPSAAHKTVCTHYTCMQYILQILSPSTGTMHQLCTCPACVTPTRRRRHMHARAAIYLFRLPFLHLDGATCMYTHTRTLLNICTDTTLYIFASPTRTCVQSWLRHRRLPQAHP